VPPKQAVNTGANKDVQPNEAVIDALLASDAPWWGIYIYAVIPAVVSITIGILYHLREMRKIQNLEAENVRVYEDKEKQRKQELKLKLLK
jgi:hypothetical protein